MITYSAPAAGDYDEFRKLRVEVINPQLRKRGLQISHRQGYYARGHE